MNARLISLTVAAKPGYPVDVELIKKLLNAHALDWMSCIAGSFLLWTHLEIAVWARALQEIPNVENGYFILIPVDPNAPIEGWYPQWAWDWIFKHRPHTPLSESDRLKLVMAAAPKI